jgi:hypothetical protein
MMFSLAVLLHITELERGMRKRCPSTSRNLDFSVDRLERISACCIEIQLARKR